MMSSLSHRLAEELQLKIVGPPLEITGITSPNHPEKNQLIPLLELKGKNREGIASALSVGNCFLTTEEIYHELHSEIPNRHTWLLTSAAEIRTVFIALLIRFDTYHTPRPSLLLESVGGKVSENSQKALRELGTRIPEDAFIGPQTVIGERSEIGSGTVVLGQTYIGYDVKIGKNAFIHPQVTIHNGTQIGNNTIIHSGTVLGSDGFGYEPSPQGMRKIPQIGNVKIGDDVEIGSNCSVDRANLNSTQIGNRVKIDNLVQIGHNVSIGDDSVIVSQTGIAGSTVIGKQVVLGGQVGVADHVVIGDGVKVASKSGILPNKKIPPGTVLRGIPAIEHIQQTRIEIAMKNLIKKTSGSQDIDTKHLLPIHIPQYGIYDIYHNDNNELVVICFYVDRNPEKIQYEYNHRLLPFTVYPCANKISCVYKLGGVDYQERIRLIIDGNVVATSVNKYPVYRDEIIFSTLVKNEDNYIKQWIQFHLNIGIKRVIIYDNGEGDDKGYSHTSVERSSNLPVLLKEYIDSGTVLLIKWAYPKRMHGMINGQTTQQCHSIHAFQTSKYIGLFDIDEYVNIQRKTNIDTFFKDLIAERRIDVEKIGGFQIRNKFFFNPEHLPTAGLEFLKIFHCSAVTKKGCEKSFVIPKKVNTYNIHNVSNGTKLYRVDPRYVFFNHYYFLNKPIRGRNLTDLKDDSILIHLD